MNYDKVVYLFWSGITLMIIFGASFLFSYGRTINPDPQFNQFFSWFVALIMLNLFNILVNLVFHFFKKDLPGPKGLKGDVGDRGMSGSDFKCLCDGLTKPIDTGMSMDDVPKIETRGIKIDGSTATASAFGLGLGLYTGKKGTFT